MEICRPQRKRMADVRQPVGRLRQKDALLWLRGLEQLAEKIQEMRAGVRSDSGRGWPNFATV